MTRRWLAAALAGLAVTGCIGTGTPAPGPQPAAAAPVSIPARAATAVVARQDFMGNVPLARLTGLRSYFDVVQPGEQAPGQWDVAYHLQLTRDQAGTLGPMIAVWVSMHHRFPARKVVARPRFDGLQWLLWISPAGQLTFTLDYAALHAATPTKYSTQALVRRWTYGHVDFLDMLRWLKLHEYLPDQMRLGSVTFGFEGVLPGEFTVRKYSLNWHAW